MALRLIEDFFEVGANPENISGSGWKPEGGRVEGSGCVGPGGAGSSPLAGTGQWIAYPGQAWSSPINEIYLGFAFRCTTTITTDIVSLWGTNNTIAHFALSMDATNRLIVKRGSTVIGTAAMPFSTLNQWRSINIYYKINSGTTTADGAITVKVDGISVITLTGQVTRNGGVADLGIDGLRVDLPSSSSSVAALCDLVMCDNTGTLNNTYPQDVACIRRLPNANGTYNDFIGSDGNYDDNYLLVRDNPTNTNTFTYATEDGMLDSYGVEDLPAATLSVKGLRAVAKTSKSGAGIASMSTFIRENGEDTFSSSVPLSTSFAWQGGAIHEKAPSTDAAWTISDVNALEIGVRSEAS